MRPVLLVTLVAAALGTALAQTPAELWRFQGIEDVNAFAILPDVDGDTIADVLVETYDAGAVGDHLYLLSGSSAGAPGVLWSIRPSSGASDGGGYGQECLVSCDDLNGDAFPDALLGTAWGNRSVHAVDGITGAVLWTFDTYDEPASGWIYAVRSHPDRTGDGRPEVVFGAGSDCHRGYLLDGATGAVIWRFIGSSDAIGHTVSLPDVNADGIADVLFCGWDNEHRVFCVSGAGSVAGAQLWAYDTGASNHSATAIDDVDGDGVPDVVVGTWQGANQVKCLSGRTGQFLWDFDNGSSNYIMRLVTVGDLDGDGLRDVAVGSWSNGLATVSARDGSPIWISYAGALNGGDFWTVAGTDDLDGDGVGEVVGGSFDYKVYLFAGADGDTLWTYDTGNRLYCVAGAPDLSGNAVTDVLAGTQYLSGGGRAYALEGGEDATGVGDLPEAAGVAAYVPEGVELRWRCAAPVGCVVDRVVDDGGKARGERLALAASFARGELTTRDVLAAVHAEKAQGVERLTAAPVAADGVVDGAWTYRLVDGEVPGGVRVAYRVSAVDDGGVERLLLELVPGRAAPRPLLPQAVIVPNPFNPRAEVRFTLDRPAAVSLAVHDMRGRQVAAMPPRPLGSGDHVLSWDGRGHDGRALPAGTYFLQLRADGETRTLKAALVR
ncbi:MAG TPA: FG-GAP-like repeat-containing protein [Candidatus Krumholzibacteria bacterium]|nr:FG-GAP-like repeat-containing protein [Candidatus Krumholzibacteria bacterium]HPD70838.1 FG-GAP-like repeat-containing protein [Candidatus Krumholzibacteria bacterium]HRY39462.1 FG-GAP-like repeat-containing protein [Candidatus Krumholzibacteria bacterium]